MTQSIQEKREKAIVTLEDAVRLVYRASQSKNQILGENKFSFVRKSATPR